MKTKETKAKLALPKGIRKADLKCPSWKKTATFDAGGSYGHSSFELWYTQRFGWVVPTLQIAGQGKRSTRRTYGITIENKKLVSVGHGPHVLNTVTVYVSKGNKRRVKPYTELYLHGMTEAGDYRDSLSTRRANSRMRRASWGF